MSFDRYLSEIIEKFLEKKMVFLGGPRQVGKTTLCLKFLTPPNETNPAYLNWDNIHDKQKLKQGQLPNDPILVIDEIHKFKLWRNLIKGFYDKKKSIQKFIITGSARLDHYRRGGDSLMGRYRYLRLHPFSVCELKIKTLTELQRLLDFGGFPEPYSLQDLNEWKLWSRERTYRIIYDDIKDLEFIREVSKLELLVDLLPSRIGSPLSINNLAQDLEVNHRTVSSWLSILEKVYYCYRILPYGPSKIKAVKKEQKLYLWDWSQIILFDSKGAKFENLVASHLLKYCHFIEDTQGEKMELRYLRDVEKREIDFILLKNNKPLFAVECKSSERKISPHIKYFRERTNIPFYYQVHLGELDYSPENNVRILPFISFCYDLKLV